MGRRRAWWAPIRRRRSTRADDVAIGALILFGVPILVVLAIVVGLLRACGVIPTADQPTQVPATGQATSSAGAPVSVEHRDHAPAESHQTAPPASGGSVHVRGYYRRDGTYVHPHTRSR